jgi:hypothetical protein
MMRVRLACGALAFGLSGFATAQIPPPGATPPQAAQAAPVNRQCVSVQRRVAKEERALALASESISTNRRAREGCPNKSTCSRYDDAIKAMEARKARHDTRLTKFKIEADKVCKAG